MMVTSAKLTHAAAQLHIGCAGWSIPRAASHEFATQGSALERYAARFSATEINSSFYRSHKPSTYARWAASVPDAFRFSVKVPKTITHELRLAGAGALFVNFMLEVSELGHKLGCLLVQLPPSLEFNHAVADSFFGAVRAMYGGAIACEPRHVSWFTPNARAIYSRHGISRVGADPAPTVEAATAGIESPVSYLRLHGSPRTYYSAYTPAFLHSLATSIRHDLAHRTHVWCIFDNTALGAATTNALELMAQVDARQGRDEER
jgi:uncharacterized protein YecE (DUF72 family)